MGEDSDTAQARVFLDLLDGEISAVSDRVEAEERSGAEAGERGIRPVQSWHEEQVRVQRKVLYELHRQAAALRTRFPECDDR